MVYIYLYWYVVILIYMINDLCNLLFFNWKYLKNKKDMYVWF